MSDRELRIAHPASAEELISEEDFERDERLPYWADLWPSARVLGEHVLHMQGNGRTLLELGCGAGLVTTCAALAGFEVTASDYYEDAVRFAEWNASKHGAPIARGMHLDWRHLPEDLARYDLVIASDVLYERPYGEIVARVIARTLAADGTALVADPGRVGRENFLQALSGHGLQLRSLANIAFEEGSIRQSIALIEIVRTT